MSQVKAEANQNITIDDIDSMDVVYYAHIYELRYALRKAFE